MNRIEIIAAGFMRDANQKSLFDDYIKQINLWSLTVHELNANRITKKTRAEDIKKEEASLFHKKMNQNAQSKIILLDEGGRNLNSMQFTELLCGLESQNFQEYQFLIGGAYGFSDDIKARAVQKISFGAATWPHMMVRIMLVEQIYRAQQIYRGHPYHKA